jgi:hypothetical protein
MQRSCREAGRSIRKKLLMSNKCRETISEGWTARGYAAVEMEAEKQIGRG